MIKNIENKGKKYADAIYLHIPFCTKKCDYCDFCTFINMNKEYEKYCTALIEEIKLYPKENLYDTIYFGGGTPSLLPVNLISDIMVNLKYKKDSEITLELNPNDITRENLKSLKEIGINRLSIGIQSFQDHILKFIGRDHTGNDAIKIFKESREVGFENISVDLMFGIPNQSLDDLKKDLELIKELSPENISIYSLIWEEGTLFWSKLQKGILFEMDQDLEADMFEYIIDFLTDLGYIHYEISNFSKENMYGKHNIKYWENKEFIGVGLSASEYLNGIRTSNVKNFHKYYYSLKNKKKPIDEKTIEIVDEKEKEKLKSMLGLRLVKKGTEYFNNKKIENLLKDGLLEIFENEEGKKRLRLTRKGILLANNVFIEFV
ncbi:MAG: radical SAM family heme chaperone HemW [Leptotrichiaceae bacterium]|nr:radical SAM family heme chaperone HemW [Leptotrichiaceae bacterium]MBP6281606.1 radical SAM family heme chaperone HemW [Leptotrichiaceae bacterium]MBP7101372.1 radical SAM family heme chaperone HemW [Leptotrichiaceae bacterium]MBP7725198.1 radical SAM family heme chaperone HemW [Leptotrichiaceae bacterium]MBP9629897.1 radical SAM family heme chaperone HemW [Leptotrichiaceae bacterium]